jgi:hypothetical protein
MSNNKKIMIGVGGLLVLAILLVVGFMVVQRTTQGSAFGFRPGMMMHGESGSGSAPKRLIAVSVTGAPVVAVAGSEALPENMAAQKAGNLNVKLALSPFPPVSFQKTDFSVTLTDEAGQPVTDAVISVDLTMPEMPMPANAVDIAHAGQGVYNSPGRFTMRGWWRIEVLIARGGTKQSVFFDLGL